MKVFCFKPEILPNEELFELEKNGYYFWSTYVRHCAGCFTRYWRQVLHNRLARTLVMFLPPSGPEVVTRSFN